jgi:hypothetical protein
MSNKQNNKTKIITQKGTISDIKISK